MLNQDRDKNVDNLKSILEENSDIKLAVERLIIEADEIARSDKEVISFDELFGEGE